MENKTSENSIQEIKTQKGITVIKYGDTFIKINPVKVEEEVNPDRITRIDLNNLLAEIIISPVLVNRWGNILAEADAELKEEKLKFEIFCAKEKEDIRNEFVESKAKKPTIGEVDDTLILKPIYKIMAKKLIKAEKNKEIASHIFWALKDKSDKLNKLSLTIQRDDLDSLQSLTLHGIKISSRKISE